MPARSLIPNQILEIYRHRVQKLSIDKICEALDDSVSRGSVAKYVQHFDRLDKDLRERELKFEWTEPERARIPWEATSWVVDCLHTYQLGILNNIADVTAKSQTPMKPRYWSGTSLSPTGGLHGAGGYILRHPTYRKGKPWI